MKPGDLVVSTFGDKQMYKDIIGHHRIFVGTFSEKSIAVCLNFGFSSTDVPYYEVLVDGMLGWVRMEGLRTLT